MKIVEKTNTYGGTIMASMHMNADTEASIGDSRDEDSCVVRIGDLNIFGTDEDLETLARAVLKHIQAKRRKNKATF